jgi:predicted acyltransferase
MSEPLPQPGSARLVSLDAYRGFIMLAMAGEGFGFPQVAKQFPDSPVWQFLGRQFNHVPWAGCSFWDLIQPAFMFMVGVSMAYSYASRQAKGQSFGRLFGHAVFRAAVLILLGIFLYSNGRPQTNFVFKNVLAQIGLGYVFLFLLWNRPRWLQATAAGAILVGYWLLFVLYPLPAASFDYSSVGLFTDWPHFTGFAAHWDKNTNAAAALDRWFLNLFPRPEPFVFDKEGYTTLNFIPSLATMIFGLMTSELLRSQRTATSKFWRLIAYGIAALAVGTLLELIGVCPIVKRIWTPSFTLYSTGWVLLMLAAFYGPVELRGWRRWTWPLAVVGMNSLAIYCMSQLLTPWIERTLQTHFGSHLFDLFGAPYAPIAQSLFVVLVLWLICVWMYRQRIFVRI